MTLTRPLSILAASAAVFGLVALRTPAIPRAERHAATTDAPGASRTQGGGAGQRMLARLDANTDGALSRDEVAGMRLFDRLDRDGDGVILSSEVPDRDRARERFETLDGNHDGRLERSEAEAAREQRFMRADTDGDGLLTSDELKQARSEAAVSRLDANHDGSVTLPEFGDGRAVARLDGNDDGRITKDELPADPRAARIFERLDRDHDGTVSRSEVDDARKATFERLDASHDGRLDASEMAAARRARGAKPEREH